MTIGPKKIATILLIAVPSAHGQQVGSDEIAIQTMRLVESRLDHAAVRLSLNGQLLLWDLVRHAAEWTYENNMLGDVQLNSKTLADRLIEVAKMKNDSKLEVTEKSFEAICPLEPFC